MSNIFDALYKAQKYNKAIIFDTRVLDIALRFRMAGVLTDREFKSLCKHGIANDGLKISKKLSSKLFALRVALEQANNAEIAKTIVIEKIEETLKKIESIFKKMED